jgi:hypothetical protein
MSVVVGVLPVRPYEWSRKTGDHEEGTNELQGKLIGHKHDNDT